jgi:hypothetical protein
MRTETMTIANKSMLLALMVTITAQASPTGALPDVLLERPIEGPSKEAAPPLSLPRMALDDIHTAFEALEKQRLQAAEQAQELTVWLSMSRQKTVVMQSALESFFAKHGRNGEQWDCQVNNQASRLAQALLIEMQSHLSFLDEHCPEGCDEERKRAILQRSVLESMTLNLSKKNQEVCS